MNPQSILIFLLSIATLLMGCTTVVDQTSTIPAAEPQINIVAENLFGPIGLTALPDGSILVAEEGTGQRDNSAGITLIQPDGEVGRLISGLPSTQDSGDLAGVPLVALSPDEETIYIGNFGQGHLWTLPLTMEERANGLALPETPYTTEQLGQAMQPLNNVQLVNPFDITFDQAGRPVVTDASANGVAKENPDGTTRFIHRFERIPNPITPADPIEAVPTGITRIGDEYYITLTGGCPYPEESGQLVAIDEARNQRTVVEGLNMPIDVAQGPDGTIWVLEFAKFSQDASCFTGEGYQPETGRLSRLKDDGALEVVLDKLNFPGEILPMPDGTLYLSEVLTGRVLHITFGETEAVAAETEATVEEEVEAIEAIVEATPEAPLIMPPEPTEGIRLRNVAEEVGIDFQQGAFQTDLFMDPVAAMGGGLCWIDYDNDGWLDLYLVNSHALEEIAYWDSMGGLPTNALYRNHAGRFEEVSAPTGTDLALRGNGCVAADFNRDGWADIYVTADGPNALLWNQGDGTFAEGGEAAGVAASEWNSAAVVGDLNQDGWPDLFVAAYIDMNNKIPKPSGAFPQDFYGLPDRLYMSQGLGPEGLVTFQEMAVESGLIKEERGLGALLSDLDLDGDLDLYIANDGHPNRLYANEPIRGGVEADTQGLGFRFVDMTEQADVGDSGSGMGIAGGDYDGDGWFDLLVTNWVKEYNALYRNEQAEAGYLTFQYSTFRIGISGLGNGLTGWGVHFIDMDHDTDQDMFITQGRVPITNFETDPEVPRLYRNRSWNMAGDAGRQGHFVEWTKQAGLEEVGPLLGRGSAAADYDNDGDLDVAINTIAGQAVLLRNEGVHGNWLQIGFDGFYPGARVTVDLTNGRQLVREWRVGSSYLASEDNRLHFGLGETTTVPRLVVDWPDGESAVLEDVDVNQTLVVAHESKTK